MKIERINPRLKYNPVNSVNKTVNRDISKNQNVVAGNVQNFVVTGKGDKIKIKGLQELSEHTESSDNAISLIENLDPSVKGFQQLQEYPESIVRSKEAISYYGGMIKTDGTT